MRAFVKPRYAELRRVACPGFNIVLVRRQCGQRNANEVYEVVTGKCHCQCKRSEQHYNAEYVYSYGVEHLHYYAE